MLQLIYCNIVYIIYTCTSHLSSHQSALYLFPTIFVVFCTEWVKSYWDYDFTEIPALDALAESDVLENENHVPNLYSFSSFMDDWINKKEGKGTLPCLLSCWVLSVFQHSKYQYMYCIYWYMYCIYWYCTVLSTDDSNVLMTDGATQII